MPTPLKERIVAALADFAANPNSVAPPDLFVLGLHFFEVLGYNTSRQARLPDNSAKGFVADFVTSSDSFSSDRARTAEWRAVELLFQLTQAEVINQVSLFDTGQVDRSGIETYLFWAIELTAESYSRAELAGITREVNRLFLMPCFIIFRYGGCITLATIDRRPNKRDVNRDVLGKITLIKSIDLREPHPGHIAILHDLSFGELYQRYHFSSIDGLHQAWLKTLDVALLNKRFYRELYSWYEWAAQPESGVVFPRPASDATGPTALSEDAYRRLSLIRLLTRVIFVWFLREKKLVPTDLFLPATLKKHIKGFDPQSEDSSFYQGILQNLFFATLNTPMRRDVEARLAAGEADAVAELRRFARDGDHEAYTDQTQYRGEELFINPAAALKLFENVPFLNGGLFECLDSRNPDGTEEQRYDGFSTQPEKRATVPNALFFGEKRNLDQSQAFGGDKKQRKVTAHGLLVILDRYKFTVAENTPLEEEVALDPELLGKVFENLLATYNPETQTSARKLTGSFYTPREIVDYMVDESLRAYLAQALPAPAGSIAAQRLSQLFEPEDPAANDPNPFGADSTDTINLIGALSRCRVLDPACGSGAFPMGVLHRMVALLRRLDPENRHFQAEQLRLADEDIALAEAISAAEVREPAVRNAEHRRATILASFKKDDEAARAALSGRRGLLIDGLRRQNYARKLFLIENCIYGVDIQQIAVQIAKLRFFISLLAEQRVDDNEENRNILAMPNLETKFVAANTLVPLDRTGTLADQHLLVKQREEELQQLRKQLFFVRKYTEKHRLRQREKVKRRELSLALEIAGFSRAAANQVAEWSPLDVMHPASFFDPETMFGLTDGFDVVIGNPPYVSHDRIGKEDKKNIQANYLTYDPFADLFCYFIERGILLQRTTGVLSFIISNSFLKSDYGKPLRDFIQKQNNILQIINLPESQVFDSVIVNAAILTSQKAPVSESIVVNSSYLSEEPFASFVQANAILYNKSDFNTKTWPLCTRQELAIIKKIGSGSKTIEQFNTKIRLGLATGENDAFIIDEAKKADFIKQDPKNEQIIKPILRGRDISRYYHTFPGLYILLTKNGIDVEKQYPTIYSYFDGLGERFKKRSAKGQHWTNLRACSFFDDFAKEKIIWIELTDKARFSLAKEEIYLLNSAYFLLPPPNIDAKYLLSILNSKVIQFYLETIAETSGVGTNRWFNNYVKEFPIKELSKIEQGPFIQLVEYVLWLKGRNNTDSRAHYFEQVLDGLVYELYFPDELKANNCEVKLYLPSLPVLPDTEAEAEEQLQLLYSEIEDKHHPVRKALFFMDTVDEVSVIEGKRK